MELTRTIWTDDDGSGTSGTILNNAVLQAIWDAIETSNVHYVDATELTISTGAVTATQNFHKIDTESDASTDDLDTITPSGLIVAGSLLAVKLAAAARIVTLKDGTGNLDIGTDIIMVADQVVPLIYNGSSWELLGSASTLVDKVSLTLDGTTTAGAPAVSPSGDARLHYNSDDDELKVSTNGGAYKLLSGIETFTPTVADVDNTASEITFLSFTVGANVMADGDVIRVDLFAEALNNSGSNRVVTWDLAWGATQAEIYTKTYANGSSVGYQWMSLLLMRVGSDLWAAVGPNDKDHNGLFQNDTAVLLSGPTFSSSQTVAFKMQLATAHASFYFKPKDAHVRRMAA